MKTQWINEDGNVIKEGMKVSGWIIGTNKWGTIYSKDIEGIVIKENNKLFVNSIKEPHKKYSLGKFCHNFMSNPNVSMLKIIN